MRLDSKDFDVTTWRNQAHARNHWPTRNATADLSNMHKEVDENIQKAKNKINAMQENLNVDLVRLRLYHNHASFCDHFLITCSGFMTEESLHKESWGAFCKDNTVCYAVEWEAGSLQSWVQYLESPIARIRENPWSSSQQKASAVGKILAELLLSQPTLFQNKKITVLGHSLGGAMIASLLQHLAAENEQRPPQERVYLNQAIMFGAAFVPPPNFKQAVAGAFDGVSTAHVVNVYSTEDNILKKVFRFANFHSEANAAGCNGIMDDDVENVNVTHHIPESGSNFGHSYGPSMPQIHQELLDANLLLHPQ